MNLEEAKKLLDGAKRCELRDHAFGDMEVFWTVDGEGVADGYFSCSTRSVSILGGPTFTDDDADALQDCGTLDEVWRNDNTGPETFQAGVTMPGLTKEGVFEELTGADE